MHHVKRIIASRQQNATPVDRVEDYLQAAGQGENAHFNLPNLCTHWNSLASLARKMQSAGETFSNIASHTREIGVNNSSAYTPIIKEIEKIDERIEPAHEIPYRSIEPLFAFACTIRTLKQVDENGKFGVTRIDDFANVTLDWDIRLGPRLNFQNSAVLYVMGMRHAHCV